MKLELTATTLICVDCVSETSVKTAVKVLERCKSLCNFGAVKLLTSEETDYEHKIKIDPIKSLVHYSIFCLKRLHEFIDTKHMLIVQGDGWILNPDKWEKEWEQLDFIAALFNQYNIMGAGGFSFRSKALMESVSNKYPHWNGSNTDDLQRTVGYYEDGAIAMPLRNKLEEEGFKFATLEQGARFSQGGNPNPTYHVDKPFGFHGSFKAIDQTTGIVTNTIKHDGFIPQPI